MYVAKANDITGIDMAERRAPHGSGIVWSILFASIGWTVALLMI